MKKLYAQGKPMLLDQPPMEPADLASLAHAVVLLEKDSFITILARMAGRPVNAMVASLPPVVGETSSGGARPPRRSTTSGCRVNRFRPR